MYRIEKVLNNNSILASKDNQEVIFLGKGIGFGKKINDIYIPSDGVKKDKMETKEQEKRLPHEIIRNVDPVFIEIASDIIRFAQEQFDHVDTKILQLKESKKMLICLIRLPKILNYYFQKNIRWH